jgi:hypothetical protein
MVVGVAAVVRGAGVAGAMGAVGFGAVVVCANAAPADRTAARQKAVIVASFIVVAPLSMSTRYCSPPIAMKAAEYEGLAAPWRTLPYAEAAIPQRIARRTERCSPARLR